MALRTGRSPIATPSAATSSLVRGFKGPSDLALGDDDVVYVLNRSSEYRDDGLRITVLSLDEQYISEFGSHGEGDGQMIWPTSIALDSQSNVYMADEWLNRITVFNKDGEFLSKWGTPGSGDGQLDRPAGIRISSDGTMFVSDSRNNRIQKFTLDGQYLGQFGSFGSGPGQLDMPWGIGLDRDNNVYVADWRNDRIVEFSPDGQYQATFGGQHGSGIGQFNRPSSVAVDQDGDVYIADRPEPPGAGIRPRRSVHERTSGGITFCPNGVRTNCWPTRP